MEVFDRVTNSFTDLWESVREEYTKMMHKLDVGLPIIGIVLAKNRE